MITIHPFKAKHLPLLIEMLKSQKYEYLHQVSMKGLPKIGFIAMLGAYPIAAGFLRKVEGGLGQFDTLASNAEFGSHTRHEGIKLVVDELTITAKDLKLMAIVAFTRDEGIINRAKSIGFKASEYSLITLDLTKAP